MHSKSSSDGLNPGTLNTRQNGNTGEAAHEKRNKDTDNFLFVTV
jgi:hypothetical protein